MFRRRADIAQPGQPQPTERITSVLGDGVSLRGKLTGTGGVRIEGSFDGEVELDGLFVIGPTGRVTCQQLRAKSVIVAGALRGDILAEKVEIRATGRVWGNVVTTAISTEEGAFLRGQIQMEEKVDMGTESAEIAPAPQANEPESGQAKPKRKKTTTARGKSVNKN